MSAIEPRVNAKHMQNFIGKVVRLPCKMKNFTQGGTTATVTASDEGEVIIKLLNTDIELSTTYVEFIGKVIDAGTLQIMAAVPMEGDLDLAIVDKTIELMHDPRFEKIFNSVDVQ